MSEWNIPDDVWDSPALELFAAPVQKERLIRRLAEVMPVDAIGPALNVIDQQGMIVVYREDME